MLFGCVHINVISYDIVTLSIILSLMMCLLQT